MATLGSLYIELKATVDPLISDFKRVQKESEETTKYLKPVKEAALDIGEAFSAVGDLVVGTLAEMTLKTAEYGAAVLKMSEQTGAGTEEISRLQYAAGQTETSVESLGNGLKILAKNADLAADGNKKQADAFASLGISVTDVNGNLRPLNDLFLDVADRMSKMEDGTQKAADAQVLLGKNGMALIPMLDQGRDGLAAMGDKADMLGLTMSGNTAEASKTLMRGIDDLKSSAEGIGITIGTMFIPTLTALAANLTAAAVETKNFAAANPDLVTAVGAIALVIGGAGGLLLGLAGIVTVYPAVVAGIGAIEVAATAAGVAFTALGPGAIAVAMLALVTFTYEVADATGLIDGLAKKIGDWTGANKVATDANKDFETATNRLNTTLIDEGITIDKGNLSYTAWNAQLVAAQQAHFGLQQKVDASKTSVEDHTRVTKEAEAAAKAFQKAVDDLVDSTDGESKKDKELTAALQVMSDQHTTVAAVTKAHGKAITDMVDQMKAEGVTVDANTLKWYNAVIQQNAANEASKIANDATIARKMALDDENIRLDTQKTVLASVVTGHKMLGDALTALSPQTIEEINNQIAFEAAVKKSMDALDNPTAFQDIEQRMANTKTSGQALWDLLSTPPAMDTTLVDTGLKHITDSTAETLKSATKSVSDAAGGIFDDMFVKGQNVFTSLGDMLKGGALSIGKSIFDDVVGQLGGPIKKAFDDFFSSLLESTGLKSLMTGLAGKLSGALSGILGGAGSAAGAAGGIASGAVGSTAGIGTSAGGSSTALTSLLTNPWTIAIGAGVLGVTAWLKSQAHWEANTVVKNIENPFWASWGQILPTDNLTDLAALDGSQASDIGTKLSAMNANYMSLITQFETGGSDEKTVGEQSLQNTQPHVAEVLQALRTAVTQGGGVPSFAVGSAKIPNTGLAMVHQGERIVTAHDNEQLVPLLQQILAALQRGMNVTLDGKSMIRGLAPHAYRLTRDEGVIWIGAK